MKKKVAKQISHPFAVTPDELYMLGQALYQAIHGAPSICLCESCIEKGEWMLQRISVLHGEFHQHS